jgi:hypothetical protein
LKHDLGFVIASEAKQSRVMNKSGLLRRLRSSQRRAEKQPNAAILVGGQDRSAPLGTIGD